MKKFIVLLIFLSSTIIVAQNIDRDSIIGSWKVVEIEKSPNKVNFKSVVDGYRKATFQLKKDSTMVLKSGSSNAIFSYILKSVKFILFLINTQNSIPRLGGVNFVCFPPIWAFGYIFPKYINCKS